MEENKCKGKHIAKLEPVENDGVILGFKKSQGLKMKLITLVSSLIW